MFALTTVADISEDELMASAKYLIDRQRRSENAMDVDVSEGYVPPLWSYLFACLSYPFSAAPMRLAIRKHLPDAQDLVEILEILENWIQGGTEHEMEALLKSLSTNMKTSSKADSPPYPRVFQPTLVSYRNAYPLSGHRFPASIARRIVCCSSPVPALTRSAASTSLLHRARDYVYRQPGAATWGVGTVCEGTVSKGKDGYI